MAHCNVNDSTMIASINVIKTASVQMAKLARHFMANQLIMPMYINIEIESLLRSTLRQAIAEIIWVFLHLFIKPSLAPFQS